ncbi:Chitinase 2 [Sporothrix bragantina]|uniref:chitinase n=1 Tax=Sporothrix bragantina TaxID=671064 RepID=A0ABP0CXD9_9PEZI
MRFYKSTAAVAVSFYCLVTSVAGSFSSTSAGNIAIYWGQNSYGAATGASNAQQRLSYYCSNTQFDIIPLAFLDIISNPDVNFANAGDNCTAFSGSTLLDCPQLEEDIQTCQSKYGKTIMLSIGGATYTEGGFSSSESASTAADKIWAMFGPVQSGTTVDRPFGNAVVDGFDFDFESSTSNMAPFASALRSKMDAATAAGDKPYYLSAAPQCPYPDVADNDMLAGAVSFDFVMVQFYNNYCGLPSFVSGSSTQNNFNFETWDNWAKTVSKNPNVRVLLGIPGSPTAAGSGYTTGSSLASIITYVKQFSSFGGIMIWDMSQVYANTGFLDQIVQGLGSGSSLPTTTAATTAASTATIPTTTPNPTLSSGPYINSSEALSTQTSFSSTTTITISTVTTMSTKTTTPGQVPGNTKPTTFSTVTRSTTGGSQSATTAAGSCGAGSATTHTVTSFVTVTAATQQAANSQTTPATKPSTTSVAATTVQQWDQCGGIGYTGSTQCAAPYKCVQNSVWWAQCQ